MSSEGSLPFLSDLQHQQDPQPGAFVPSPSVKTFLWCLSQASFWLMPWLMCLLSAADQSWHLNRNSAKIFMFYKMINISKKSVRHKILTTRNQLSTFTKMASGAAFVISSFDNSNVRNASITIIGTSSIFRCVFADFQTLIFTQKGPDCTNEAPRPLRPN